MAISTTRALEKLRKQACACCSIFHDPSICVQCQVAGCGATLGKKNHKCRLQGTLLSAMELSPFQLQARVAELERQNAELLAEAQHLARLLNGREIMPGQFPVLDAIRARAQKESDPAVFSMTGNSGEAIRR